MGIINLNSLGDLPPEVKAQAEQLLAQYPQLNPEAAPPAPTKPAGGSAPAADGFTMDYSSFTPQAAQEIPLARINKSDFASAKIDPKNNSFDPKPSIEDAPRSQPKEGEFNPEGKMHPILKKMRATLGMGVKKQTVDVTVAGVQYRMALLDHTAATRAVVLAATSSMSDEEYRINVDTALVAYAVTHVDGIPVEEVFEVPMMNPLLKDPETGRSVKYMTVERRQLGAQAFYNFVKESPSKFAETLEQLYKQEFPSFELLMEGQVYAYCPTGGCQYSRITKREDKTFCPYHGKELVAEDNLPNPSQATR